MNELAIKLAGLLDITTKAAIDLYPLIRDQYLAYGVASTVSDILLAILIISLIVSISVTGILVLGKLWDAEDFLKNIKVVRWLYIVPILFLLMLTLSTISKYVFAPDIMIIMEFMK